MSGSLDGKVAVVTGSSRGIGRGTAIALGEQGATVYVTGRTTGDGELTIDTTVRLVDDGRRDAASPCRPTTATTPRSPRLFERVGGRAGQARRARQQRLQDPRSAGVGRGVLGPPDVDLGRPGRHRAARPLRGVVARCAAAVRRRTRRGDHQRLVTGRAVVPLQLVLRRRQGRARPAQCRHGHRAGAEGHRLLHRVPGQRGDRVHQGVGREARVERRRSADPARRRPRHRRPRHRPGPDGALAARSSGSRTSAPSSTSATSAGGCHRPTPAASRQSETSVRSAFSRRPRSGGRARASAGGPRAARTTPCGSCRRAAP